MHGVGPALARLENSETRLKGVRAALTDNVLMNDVTLVLKSDWFALYAATGTNHVVPGLLPAQLARVSVAPRG